MNILVVTAYPPVLHRHGGGVRMFHNIRILGSKHRVHVLSFVGSDQEQDMLEPVRLICESVKAVRRIPDFRPHWLSLKPFLVREFSTPAMHHAVNEVVRKQNIDVVQCEYLQMAQFRRGRCGSVLTAHEVLSQNAYEEFVRASDAGMKLKLFYRWMQMLKYETGQVKKFDRVITMTGEDAVYLRSYAPEANIAAVPIGIDAGEFTPHAPDPGRPVEVMFVGNFNHSPNVEAAHFLVREMAPRFPNILFAIHGTPVPGLPAADNVSFPGYVPDTRILYRRPNTIVAAPLFSGTGQRVKLLEAFAMACPVITTTVGAMGFPVQNGVEALLANSVAEFAGALEQLACSLEYRTELGNNARRMILEGFTWDSLSGALLDAVEEASVSD